MAKQKKSVTDFNTKVLGKKKFDLSFTKRTHQNFAINMNFSVAKLKKSVAFATMSVAISSPAIVCRCCICMI